MKSRMKQTRSTKLQRFIVGGLATAAASGANGATVQISFPNNVVNSTSQGGQVDFLADLSGDTFPDIGG